VSDFVNVNDVGQLSGSAQQYGVTGDEKAGAARTFQGQMEAGRAHLIGQAGTSFQNVGALNSTNLSRLAAQIAEQALRTARANKTIVASDDEGASAQQGAQSAAESHTSVVSRPINV